MFKINGLYFYLLSVYWLFYQLTQLKQLYTRVMPVLAYVRKMLTYIQYFGNSQPIGQIQTLCDVDMKLVVLSLCFVQPVMTVS